MMIDEKIIQDWIKSKIKRELGWRGMSYADLVVALNGDGANENEVNFRNKISRGTFSASYFVRCLVALEVSNLNIDIQSYIEHATTAKKLDGISRADLDLMPSKVRLPWSHKRPSGEYSEVLLPGDSGASANRSNILCGNCDEPLLTGKLKQVRKEWENTKAVGRCSSCLAYVGLPGSEVQVEQ